MVFGLNGVQWVMSCWVLDLLTSWLGNLGWPRALVVWRVVPHCVMFVFGGRGTLDILRIVREIHFRVQIVVFPNIIWVSCGAGFFSLHSLEELIGICILDSMLVPLVYLGFFNKVFLLIQKKIPIWKSIPIISLGWEKFLLNTKDTTSTLSCKLQEQRKKITKNIDLKPRTNIELTSTNLTNSTDLSNNHNKINFNNQHHNQLILSTNKPPPKTKQKIN